MRTPILIKITSIILFVTAVLSLLLSFIAFSFSGFSGNGFNQAIFLVIVAVIFAIILVMVGIAIWKGRNWARIISLILTGVWSIFWIIQVTGSNHRDVTNIYFLLPGLLAFIFLLFSFFQNNCKLFFGNHKSVINPTVGDY